MNLNKIIKDLDLELSKEKKRELDKKVKFFIKKIEEKIRSKKVKAKVFIGGSYAKNTLVNSDFYDIDIFVKFDKIYEDLSKQLEKIVVELKKEGLNIEIKHGSRDYFRIIEGNIIFEIIPVLDIKNPREARNVTDLSYFHVKYVKNKIKNLEKQILLAKRFCKAIKVYGAESYIEGFSGYALECLIIHFKSFDKMLKKLSSVQERIIIDPEKKYKNESEILFGMNESKLNGPVIIVDPTWKERNVSSSLSYETFERFKINAKEFLLKPSEKMFDEEKVDEENFRKESKKKNADYVKLKIYTNKQEGDIAATKMKKFSKYLIENIRSYFDIYKTDFSYQEGQESDFYIIAKPKKEVVRIGPPISMVEACKKFKKNHSKTYQKNGYLHTKLDFEKDLLKFLEKFYNKNIKIVREMDIKEIKITT